MKIDWDFHEFTEFATSLLDFSKFEIFAKQATKELAKELQEMLFVTTPVKTGNLRASWGGGENCSYTITRFSYGYRVVLKNTAISNKSPKYPNFRYGLAVNDGHKTPGGGGWVMGKFFVEDAVVKTANSAELESIIMRLLQRWWKSV